MTIINETTNGWYAGRSAYRAARREAEDSGIEAFGRAWKALLREWGYGHVWEGRREFWTEYRRGNKFAIALYAGADGTTLWKPYHREGALAHVHEDAVPKSWQKIWARLAYLLPDQQ